MNALFRRTLIVLAVFAAGDGAALALEPPPLECLGNPACTGPIWRQVRYDCVTADHYARNTNCTSSPNLPEGRCDQPDVITPEPGVELRCDDWDNDFWERPFSPGDSSADRQLDIIYAMASQDDQNEWFFFLIQMYGLTGGKLDAAYAIELDTDPEILDDPCGPDGRDDQGTAGDEWDDSPCPGDDPDFPDGVSCTDWFLRSVSPTANIKEKVGFDRWGREGVIAFFDGDEDMGGLHCALNDQLAGFGSWSGSGAEVLAADQGGGPWRDGLWAMMPSTCGELAPDGYDDNLLGIEEADLPLINWNATCVVLAVRKDMLAAYLRPSLTELPADFVLAWRGWSNKGDQDNANVQLHDKYSNDQAGDAYYDESNHGPNSVKLLDSTARLGGLHLFPPEEACPPEDQAINELQAFGQFQTFTSAVAPVGQTESRNSLFLSSILPVQGNSRWPGQVRHFIQPVPIVEEDVDNDGIDDFVPDTSASCVDADDTSCLEWEADVEILAQAPNSTEVTAHNLRIGTAQDQRRVLYTQGTSFSPGGAAGMPRATRLFSYPFATDAIAIDLAQGFQIPFDPNNSTQVAQAKTQSESIIRSALVERSVPHPDDATQQIVYVLGDSFHAEPIQVGGPVNFNYLASDLGGNTSACDDTVNPNPGYRCFFDRHRFRRKILLVPSNDGQLHAFDAGNFRADVVDPLAQLEGGFDRGTGRELFSYIPREMLKHTAEMTTLDHDFGVDATPIVEDFFIDPAHSGAPTAAHREWRTVALGGFGRGARGYYALDITQPDHLDVEPVRNIAGLTDTAFVPDDLGNYVPSCTSNWDADECGALPYPAVLWEFDDLCGAGPCDDDGNLVRDLAYSWSRPNSGRVRIRIGSDVETRHVAVFGGGYDPEFANTSGNFLYMVDIETGRVLMKRLLVGPAPGEPAALDLDGDTFLDTIYQGTTAGFLYKVDISAPGVLDLDTDQILATEWVPFRIFSTGGRPIFLAPTVVFVASQGHFAVSFGTGDLQDLFGEQAEPGRYYMIVDQNFTAATTGLPFTEAQYERVQLDSNAAVANFLVNPTGTNRPGWVLELDPTEKLVSDTTAISGLLTFTTFVTDLGPDESGPTDPSSGQACFEEVTGSGRVYRLLATNANSLVGTERFFEVQGFASDPFVSPSAFSQQQSDPNAVDPFASAEMAQIRQSLMGLFPQNCRFGNFSMRVGVNLSSGEQVPVADIPQCVVVKNWKEF